MHAAEAGRVEPRPVPERRADDGVVGRRHVLEHVQLVDHVARASLARRSSRTAAAGWRVAGQRRCRLDLAAGELEPELRCLVHGLEQMLVAVNDVSWRTSAATAARRCGGTARSRWRRFQGGSARSVGSSNRSAIRRDASGSGRNCIAAMGMRRLARQPVRSSRFSSIRLPPCASAICRLSTSPIPEPPGLVVKNGTNRLPVFDSPGPSSSTHSSIVGGDDPGSRCQPTRTPPPVSRDRIDGVAQQVDQELLELIAVALDRQPRAGGDLDVVRLLERDDAIDDSRRRRAARAAAAAASRAARRRS